MNDISQDNLETYQAQCRDLTAAEMIAWAQQTFGVDAGLASSLGPEDQVLTHLIAAHGRDLSVFTLDTGRLFEETHELLDTTRAHYNLTIDVFFPNAADVEPVVGARGVNYFRESIEARKHCCAMRKVQPLKRALDGKSAWITGLRRAQSDARDTVEPLSWDAANGMFKLNPLWDWSDERLWSFIEDEGIPTNPLYQQNYPSIGCAPCTRAVQPGEHPRAGRWWWEQDQARECGLHIVDGRLVRGSTNV